MRESLNAGIGVLLGVTVVVLGLFAGFFVRLVRLSKGGRSSFFDESPILPSPEK